MPIPLILRWIMRNRLKNKNFTLLSYNCISGIVYHCLGQRFLSPTVNLMVGETMRDFYKFCSNMDYYLSLPIEQVSQRKEYPYPIGMLGDILLQFVHSKNFEDAVSDWESRKKRINIKNLYIIANDYVTANETLTKEEILAFGKLPCKNLVIFTQKPYSDIPYAYYLGPKKMGRMMCTNPLTGLRYFEFYWDYVKWINSSR